MTSQDITRDEFEFLWSEFYCESVPERVPMSKQLADLVFGAPRIRRHAWRGVWLGSSLQEKMQRKLDR